MKRAEWFRARAKQLYEVEGELEIDRDADVSEGGGDGAYVQAWVWVPTQPVGATASTRQPKPRNAHPGGH